jgi:hypothetical protein
MYSHWQFRAEWVLERDSCALLNVESAKLGIIVVLVTEIVLFIIMLSGLLRMHIISSGKFPVRHFLWKQV